MARADCFDLLPEVFAAVEPLLAAPAPRLRIHAASAAAMLSRHPDLVAHRPRLPTYHLAKCVSDDPHHRASMLLGAGELGRAPRERLRDPHPGVRVCAALAPALADDPEATAVLLAEATRNPPQTGNDGRPDSASRPSINTSHVGVGSGALIRATAPCGTVSRV